MTCKWDAEAGDYLNDGEPCRYDVDGWPTKHCTGKTRKRCTQHVGRNELTCGRCISDTRQNLRWIPDLATLARVEALDDGVQSEAAMLAGPAADFAVFEARRALDRRWLYANIPGRNLERALTALLEPDDDLHPYSVLTRWHLMLAEDYGDELPARMSVANSTDYLTHNLNRFAQDPGQEFSLFRSEVRKVREHLEAVLHNSSGAERGALCPECVADCRGDSARKFSPERLRREYAYWKFEGEEKGWVLRYRTAPGLDDEAEEHDRWVCPRNRAHVWGEAEYRKWIEERTA